MALEKMQRVSREKPCPICHKIDWCLFAEDGSAAICQRIQEGSVKKCGEAGYLHILVDRPKGEQHRLQRRFIVGQNEPDRNFTALQQQYSRQIKDEQLNRLSQQLGVSTQSLNQLYIGWDGTGYTFPMFNDFGKIIGIRRRFTNGDKGTLKGSQTGLFIPADLSNSGPLLLCEGPTDTAAALDLGFDAIGRPNCNSKIEMAVKAARNRTEIVVLCDNDQVGRAGANKLVNALVLHYPSVKIICPPDGVKDLRQWLRVGLNTKILHEIIQEIKLIETEIGFRN